MEELALHIMDIIQNSVAASGSVITVGINYRSADDILEITVEDNGCGMNQETLEGAADPFHTSRKTRSVGLGIPMFREAALLTGGDLKIESQLGRGTKITAEFVNMSIDRQPLGDVGNVFFLNMISDSDTDYRLTACCKDRSFSFSSTEFKKETLSGEMTDMDAAFEASDIINREIRLLFEGVLPEIGGELYETK